MHTDNWRTLSGSFEAGCESAEKYELDFVEAGIIHGQYFIQAMGYEPSLNLSQNPIAIRRYCDSKGLEISQIDGSYPMMGVDGSTYGVQYVQQSIRFAKDLGCPKVDTTDSGNISRELSKDEVLKITIRNYAECLKWVEDYDIIINIEPHGPYTGEDTGIPCSEVAIGEGVNADNIKACVEYLIENKWGGDLSIECSGTDDKIGASVEYLRGIVK